MAWRSSRAARKMCACSYFLEIVATILKIGILVTRSSSFELVPDPPSVNGRSNTMTTATRKAKVGDRIYLTGEDHEFAQGIAFCDAGQGGIVPEIADGTFIRFDDRVFTGGTMSPDPVPIGECGAQAKVDLINGRIGFDFVGKNNWSSMVFLMAGASFTVTEVPACP